MPDWEPGLLRQWLLARSSNSAGSGERPHEDLNYLQATIRHTSCSHLGWHQRRPNKQSGTSCHPVVMSPHPALSWCQWRPGGEEQKATPTSLRDSYLWQPHGQPELTSLPRNNEHPLLQVSVRAKWGTWASMHSWL